MDRFRMPVPNSTPSAQLQPSDTITTTEQTDIDTFLQGPKLWTLETPLDYTTRNPPQHLMAESPPPPWSLEI